MRPSPHLARERLPPFHSPRSSRLRPITATGWLRRGERRGSSRVGGRVYSRAAWSEGPGRFFVPHPRPGRRPSSRDLTVRTQTMRRATDRSNCPVPVELRRVEGVEDGPSGSLRQRCRWDARSPYPSLSVVARRSPVPPWRSCFSRETCHVNRSERVYRSGIEQSEC